MKVIVGEDQVVFELWVVGEVVVELWVFGEVVVELWVAEPERLQDFELKPNQPILLVVPAETVPDGVWVVL